MRSLSHSPPAMRVPDLEARLAPAHFVRIQRSTNGQRDHVSEVQQQASRSVARRRRAGTAPYWRAHVGAS